MGVKTKPIREKTHPKISSAKNPKQQGGFKQLDDRQFRVLIENAMDVIMIINSDGELSYISPSIKRVFGYEPEEIIGKIAFEFIHPEDLTVAADRFAQIINSPEYIPHMEIRTLHKDGSWRYVDAIGQNLLGDPAVRGIVVNFRDVTERRQAEETLRSSKELFEELTENVSDTIVVLNSDGSIRYQSPSFKRMVGGKRSGKAPLNFVHPDDMPKAADLFAKLMQNPGSNVQTEIRGQHRDGSWRYFEVLGKNLLDNPAVSGIVANFRDITDRKQAEETVRRKLRLEETISSVSTRFVGAPDIDDAINASLADIGRLSGASRSYLFLIQENETTTDNTHEWCADGVSPQIDNLQNLPCDTFPWWMEKLRKSEVIHIQDVSKLPKEAAAEKEILEMQDIKSILVLPVHVVEKLAGFIGLDNVVETGELSNDDLLMLRIVSEIIGNALESKRAEAALQKSKGKLQLYLEMSPDAIYINDFEGILLYGNKAAERITGYSREELVGKSFYEAGLLPPEYLSKVAHAASLNEAGKPTGPDEFELIRKDGSLVYVEVSTYLMGKGDEAEVIGIARDITERKRAEEALRESEHNYRVLFESMIDGMVVIDAETMKIVLANQNTAKIYGFDSVKELLDINLLDYLHPDDRDRAVRIMMEDMFEKDLRQVNDFRTFTKDGSEKWISVVGSKIEYRGRMAGLASFRDITEQKKAEEEKRRMEQQLQLTGRLAAVGELAAGVAHELNNPLAAIQAFAQLLDSRDDLDELTMSDVGTIYKEAQRASRITGNLLSFARRYTPDRSLVSINEVIEKSLELHAYRMRVNNIEVVKELDPELPMTMADFNQLQQVFVNIITNADQAMTEAHGYGKFLIKTQKAGEMIRVSFSDNGSGISEDNLKRVFDPFFTTKDVGKGTGLGLSICYGIVQEHGGHLYARSKPDEGATFVVEIPIVSHDQSSAGKNTLVQAQSS